METLTFPAFRTDRTMVQLAELLAVIPDNKYVWSVIDFYGTGTAPNGLSMEEFENQTLTAPSGFIMTWPELQSFAGTLTQAIDGLVAGAITEKEISSTKLTEGDFSSCEIVIQVLDSTEWTVWARDAALMSKLAAASKTT